MIITANACLAEELLDLYRATVRLRVEAGHRDAVRLR